jgi:hypothetical protein
MKLSVFPAGPDPICTTCRTPGTARALALLKLAIFREPIAKLREITKVLASVALIQLELKVWELASRVQKGGM